MSDETGRLPSNGTAPSNDNSTRHPIHRSVRCYYEDQLGVLATGSGPWAKARCPWCPPDRRPALGIHLSGGAHRCHRCGRAGGCALDFHARLTGLDLAESRGHLRALGYDLGSLATAEREEVAS